MATGNSSKWLTFVKESSGLGVERCVTRYIISKIKIIVILIMVGETNNDGNNIKWSVVVVLESGCSLVFGCFLGSISVGETVLIKL